MACADDVVIEACTSLNELADVRGQLRKLRNERSFDRAFLDALFDKRDKQLVPRDLLAAYLPTRRSGRTPEAGDVFRRRAVGILRRSLKFDRARHCSSLYIDFVWVTKEARGLQIGRRLLAAGIRLGKQKDVRLLVAGSDDNLAAVRLYESVGFRWTSPLKTEMLLEKSALSPADCTISTAAARDSAADGGTPVATAETTPAAPAPAPSPAASPPFAPPRLCIEVGGADLSSASASGVTPQLSHLGLSQRRSSPRCRLSAEVRVVPPPRGGPAPHECLPLPPRTLPEPTTLRAQGAGYRMQGTLPEPTTLESRGKRRGSDCGPDRGSDRGSDCGSAVVAYHVGIRGRGLTCGKPSGEPAGGPVSLPAGESAVESAGGPAGGPVASGGPEGLLLKSAKAAQHASPRSPGRADFRAPRRPAAEESSSLESKRM